MTETVSGRIPGDLARDFDAWGKETGRSRSELLRDVVRKGLKADRLERALEAYRRREVSIGRATEMAGIPMSSFLDEMKRAGILMNYDREELARDLAWAERQ